MLLFVVRSVVCLVGLLGLCACADKAAVVYAPVSERAYQSADTQNYYTAKVGDSVYSIAWAYGLDYRDLAAANYLSRPYQVSPGKRLRVRAVRSLHVNRPPPIQPAVLAGASKLLSKDKAVSETGQLFPERVVEPEETQKSLPKQTLKASQKFAIPDAHDTKKSEASIEKQVEAEIEQSKPAPQVQEEPAADLAVTKVAANPASAAGWIWPSKGKVVSRFVASSLSGNKGIDIQGSLGQPVWAAAAGKVVYSGSGVRGYGNLIIIKHNQNYLSAYAYNQRLLVKEGDEVKAGQPIAEMGKAETGRVLLHFEIRYNGRPVDPMTYLR